MNRRHFLQAIGAGSLASTLPFSFKLHAAPEDYNGKFVINVQAEGGWDVTSMMDPKTNVPGEPEINHWARTAEPLTVGNLTYAPFANNQAFFERFYQDILVINSVDAQTNSHTAGVIHNWSGRISQGFPSLTALFAAQNGSSLPIAYINNGGFKDTGGLARYTQLSEVDSLRNIISPNTPEWNDQERYLHPEDWDLIAAARQSRLERILDAEGQTERQRRNRMNLKTSFDNSTVLNDFERTLRGVDELQQPVENGNFYSTLRRQAQLALLAMSAGVSVSADLIHWGFDTHQEHDSQHEWLFSELTAGLTYLWDYAETLGIADRLVVVVASDFSRTPWYNDTNGKDHWPIGSVMVMERNQNYTNRTIGLTNELHEAIPIDPSTHVADESGGQIIYPMHVMQELRQHLGVDGLAEANGFALRPAHQFGFFTG